MGLAYRNLTLVGSGPVITGQAGNDGYSECTLKIGMRLVPGDTSTKTGSGTVQSTNDSAYIYTWHRIN